MNVTLMTLNDIATIEPDWDRVLVYSDWLEDEGDIETAQAWRWIVRNKRWPRRVRTGSGRFGFSCEEVNAPEISIYSGRDVQYARLPPHWFSDSNCMSYDTLHNALWWLVSRCKEIRPDDLSDAERYPPKGIEYAGPFTGVQDLVWINGG